MNDYFELRLKKTGIKEFDSFFEGFIEGSKKRKESLTMLSIEEALKKYTEIRHLVERGTINGNS